MPLEVVVYPSEVLQKPARRVSGNDELNLHELFESMAETMKQAGGIGLAAPQVGLGLRMFIAHNTQAGETRAFVNPQIVSASAASDVGSEGCLSFPDQFADVERHLQITLRYQDLELAKHEEQFSDYFARVIQHELDHLNGVLLPDRAIGEMYTYEAEDSDESETADALEESREAEGDNIERTEGNTTPEDIEDS